MVTILLRNYFYNMHLDAIKERDNQIINLLQQDSSAKLLDLGCDTGDFTVRLARKINTKQCYGVEIVKQRAKEAKKKGIGVVVCDIEKGLPFKSNFFDVVCGNQIIEHLFDLDLFCQEVNQVLKRGGVLYNIY